MRKALLSLICWLWVATAFAQQPKQVELINADYLQVDERLGTNTQRLIGNVVFRHEGVMLYSDSAYLYNLTNSLDAFGQVHIVQGDSVNLYGDVLNYNGNTKQAVITGNVVLIERNNTLNTDKLNYDVDQGIGTYNTGGKIVSKKNDNVLTSQIGYYYSKNKRFYYRKNVVLVNPKYTMTGDTLEYDTKTDIAYFYGPTVIKSKENTIYCENGYYDTKRDLSSFSKNSYIVSKKQILKADSIYYNRKTGIGKGFNNVTLADTAQNLVIKGNKGRYEEGLERMVVFEKAELAQLFDKDTLYLHADTLRAEYDSCKAYRTLYAHYKVKFFKADMQGKCDSLVFSYLDSTLKMFTKPVLWNGENQLTARYMEIETKGGKLSQLNMFDVAFIVSEEDTASQSMFNQIKGKKIIGHFKDNALAKIDVYGNGQSLYYAKDGAAFIGINRADCSDMTIYIDSSKVERISFITKPQAVLYPVDELAHKDRLLKDFIWRNPERPKTREDIFKD